MRLFNKNHFPVLDEGVHFDFCYALPTEDTFSVTIKKHSIKIEPTTKHDKVMLLDLTDTEKQKLFDLIMKVDDIRLLGNNVQMLVSLAENKPFLHNLTVDGMMAPKKTRDLVCKECNMQDSVLCYDKTLTEFLKTTKLSYNEYEAIDCNTTKPYKFSLQDIFNYSKALQDTAVEVHYELTEDKPKEKDKDEFTITVSRIPDGEITDLFRSTGTFRSMKELLKLLRDF